MVLAYFPQKFIGNVTANTNFPPQSQIRDNIIPTDWFNTDWKKRFPLTIQTGKVLPLPGQTNFQMVVDSTFPELIGQTQNQLRFAVGGVVLPPQLNYEIEQFVGATGKLVAWVEIPLIEDGDVLNVYYDNSLAPPDDSNGPDVWNLGNNNLAVWHLNQTTFGAFSTLDSTGVAANNFSTDIGMNPGKNSIAGKLDGALRFDGAFDETEGAASATIRNLQNGFTVSAWVRPDNFATLMEILSLKTTGGFGFGFQSSTSLFFVTFGILLYTQNVPALPTNILTHFAVKMDSSNDAIFYLNGVNVGTFIGTNPATGAVGNYTIGGAAALPNFWDGDIDEVRVYDSELSDDLISTIFNNENDAGEPGVPGFYAVGPVEIIP